MTCQVESGVIDRSWRAVQSAAERDARDWGNSMFGLGDLFQWERFVTPTVIKVFYWLAVVIAILLGLAGVVSALTTMAYNPFAGVIFGCVHGSHHVPHRGRVRAHCISHQ